MKAIEDELQQPQLRVPPSILSLRVVCAEVNLRLAHGTSAEQVRLVRDKVAELSVTPPAADLSAFVRRFPRGAEPSRVCCRTGCCQPLGCR